MAHWKQQQTSPSRAPPPDKSYAWRMLQPDHHRKYQLLAKDKPASGSSKNLNPERAYALAMGQGGGEKADRSAYNVRARLNQAFGPVQSLSSHKSPSQSRRRKPSVTDLGHMTTVQEAPMDSPTIPGRPPFHERSSSAPSDDVDYAESMTSSAAQSLANFDDEFIKAIDDAFSELSVPVPTPAARRRDSSPKQLAPLVIPKHNAPTPLLRTKRSEPNIRSDSAPPSRETARSGRLDAPSPLSRLDGTAPSASTPDLSTTATDGPGLTPASTTSNASSSLAYSSSNASSASSAAALHTPMTAPLTASTRAFPQPWDSGAAGTHHDDASDACALSRGASESSLSALDRGRSRMRPEGALPLLRCGGEARRDRDKSSERRAFEELPQGFRPSEAVAKMGVAEVAKMQKQAVGQAERFEVLRSHDVDALSKELRQLDERTEYLRRTYASLRSGRRNLHARICQSLRSPRFTHASMVKQEETLAELDASIDDWVTRLEHAENRRTRVRQKLLEHVAAATMLAVAQPSSSGASSGASNGLGATSGLPYASSVPAASVESLIAKVPGPVPLPHDISTPPRSPSRQVYRSGNESVSSFSSSISSAASSPPPLSAAAQQQMQLPPLAPQHHQQQQQQAPHYPQQAPHHHPLHQQHSSTNASSSSSTNNTTTNTTPAPSSQRPPVAQVPSTILEQPVAEEAASMHSPRRADVESIRIYAGNDVFSLLADVEDEISRMSGEQQPLPARAPGIRHDAPSSYPEPARTECERLRSHEKLHGQLDTSRVNSVDVPSPLLPPPPTPPLKQRPADSEVLLTSAVFRRP